MISEMGSYRSMSDEHDTVDIIDVLKNGQHLLFRCVHHGLHAQGGVSFMLSSSSSGPNDNLLLREQGSVHTCGFDNPALWAVKGRVQACLVRAMVAEATRLGRSLFFEEGILRAQWWERTLESMRPPRTCSVQSRRFGSHKYYCVISKDEE